MRPAGRVFETPALNCAFIVTVTRTDLKKGQDVCEVKVTEGECGPNNSKKYNRYVPFVSKVAAVFHVAVYFGR